MKKIKSLNYYLVPDEVGQKSIADHQFCEIYDFYRIIRVQKKCSETKNVDKEVDFKVKKKKRLALENKELVLVLDETLQKKDVPGKLYKSTAENNKGNICVVFERMKNIHGNYFFWLKRKDSSDDRLSKKNL